METYVSDDPREIWFGKLKATALCHGFAARPKDFKRRPSEFKGTVAHAAQVFRVLLTGSSTSPDLYSIMQTMGESRVDRRLKSGLSS